MFKKSDAVIEESALFSIQQLKSNQRGYDLMEKQKKVLIEFLIFEEIILIRKEC